MRNFLAPLVGQKASSTQASTNFDNGHCHPNDVAAQNRHAYSVTESMPSNEQEIFTGYLSDISEDGDSEDEPNLNVEKEIEMHMDSQVPKSQFHDFPIHAPPPLKRRRLEIPYRIAHQQAREERQKQLKQGLLDIEKLFESKKASFEVGHEGLQARRGRAIKSYLFMVVKNGCRSIDASQRAAEAQGFSAAWGGYLVRCWVRDWIKSRTLPDSSRGRHIKSYSLLEDPAIRAELRSFV